MLNIDDKEAAKTQERSTGHSYRHDIESVKDKQRYFLDSPIFIYNYLNNFEHS